MQIIQTGFKAKHDYTILFETSLLWEAALGIAAVTNKSLKGTLEHVDKMWDNRKTAFRRRFSTIYKLFMSIIHGKHCFNCSIIPMSVP